MTYDGAHARLLHYSDAAMPLLTHAYVRMLLSAVYVQQST
jgi:hypothetical protein